MINQIKEQLKADAQGQIIYSENGAAMHATTGTALLDMNYKVASYRKVDESKIITDFIKAYSDTPELAVKWLFFVRDIRQGLGERRLFRTVFNWLLEGTPKANKLLQYVPEFGRYDDLLEVFNSESKSAQTEVLEILKVQYLEDVHNIKQNKSISLLGKWLPSINTSSQEKRKLARLIATSWGWTEKQYRKNVVALREYLKVTEVLTSADRWNEIDYEKVPSLANLKYKTAFFKHDGTRRQNYLDALEKGEAKINASVAFPHDIVHQYVSTNGWDMSIKKNDQTLEAMWKALPAYELKDTLVVADGSGSMCSPVGGSNVMALTVANALAIYCSEHNQGEFKDKYITFSEKPQLVNFAAANSLREKIQIASTHNEVANTNIYKVFKLILDTAVNNKMTQNEMVKNILVMSDMEVDSGGEGIEETLFNKIKKDYENAGYKIPRCIWWNLNSRTGAIPMVENELGLALVSGFSLNIIKMIMSNVLDPFECLKETLNSERYVNITI